MQRQRVASLSYSRVPHRLVEPPKLPPPLLPALNLMQELVLSPLCKQASCDTLRTLHGLPYAYVSPLPPFFSSKMIILRLSREWRKKNFSGLDSV